MGLGSTKVRFVPEIRLFLPEHLYCLQYAQLGFHCLSTYGTISVEVYDWGTCYVLIWRFVNGDIVK